MIFTGTNTRIELDTGIDLIGATDTKIRWQVAGESGEWSADIDDTKLYYETQTDDLHRPGLWRFQAVAVINGKKYKGSISTQNIHSPLKGE